MIHPSVGDVYRLLKPWSYRIHHTHYPLSESSFNVENQATNLRDKVTLTRLVEIFLYLRTTLEEDTLVAISADKVLTSMLEEGRRFVLSQHLKYPCAARAQKLYNVDIALSTLGAVCRVGQIAEDLTAENLVDGQREKTLTLLWTL